MQSEDQSDLTIPAHQSLQSDINSHSISHDDYVRTPNMPMNNSDVDFDDPNQRSAQTFNTNQLEAEHGWDVYPD
ncbi:hypothetical protein COAQ111491_21810 [Comamonas aquatilis]